MTSSYRLPIYVAAISFVFWFGLYFGAWALGWPGDPHPCSEPPYCFCETVTPGALAAQPSNTWSDLGFVFVAIFMAFQGSAYLRRNSLQHKSRNLTQPAYKQSASLIAIYVAAILYMGPGSMFFHGGMIKWGGWLDVISMYVFVNFVIAYLIYRSWALKLQSFYIIYGATTMLAIGVSVFMHDWSSRLFPFAAGTLITLALLQTVPKQKFSLGRKRDTGFEQRWLVLALGFFIAAATIWGFSDSGRPLCYPDSLLQGHAAWHLLSACMTLCIHYYFLSEKTEA